MKSRILAVLALLFLIGCEKSETTTAPPPAEKLPPEVEFDPETAAKHYQKTGKKQYHK